MPFSRPPRLPTRGDRGRGVRKCRASRVAPGRPSVRPRSLSEGHLAVVHEVDVVAVAGDALEGAGAADHRVAFLAGGCEGARGRAAGQGAASPLWKQRAPQGPGSSLGEALTRVLG